MFQARPGDEGADGIVKGCHLLYFLPVARALGSPSFDVPAGPSAPETRIYWQIVNCLGILPNGLPAIDNPRGAVPLERG